DAVGFLQSFHNRSEVLGGGSDDVYQNPSTAEVLPQPGQRFTEDARQPGVGQPNGVEHTARKFGHTRRGISRPWFGRNRLGDQAAQTIQVHHSRQLATEPRGSGGEQHGVLELLTENLARQSGARHYGATGWRVVGDARSG